MATRPRLGVVCHARASPASRSKNAVHAAVEQSLRSYEPDNFTPRPRGDESHDSLVQSRIAQQQQQQPQGLEGCTFRNLGTTGVHFLRGAGSASSGAEPDSSASAFDGRRRCELRERPDIGMESSAPVCEAAL